MQIMPFFPLFQIFLSLMMLVAVSQFVKPVTSVPPFVFPHGGCMSVLTDIVSQFYGNFFLVKLQFYVTFLTGLFITFILFYLKKNK